MAKGCTLVQIVHNNEHLNLPLGDEVGRLSNAVCVFLEKHAGGGTTRTTSVAVGQAASRATGTLTLATASGAVGGTINGVAVTVTAAGGDLATAVSLATAINASNNALISGVVSAFATNATVTLTAVEYGKTGNAVTLAASGTGVTASGARLTGGAAAGFITLKRT